MRISTTQINYRALNAMLDQQARMSDTGLRIAAQRKILTPADDPAGSARALNLTLGLELTEQHQKNITLAEARLVSEEDSLDNVSRVLARVREQVVYANNASQGTGSRQDIAAEIGQRLDELINFANTKDGSGEYIFSGFQGQTKAFSLVSGTVVYNGDQGQRFAQISNTRQIATADPGSDVFVAIRNGNSDFVAGAGANNRGTGVVSVGSVVDDAAYATISQNSYSIVMADRTTATNSVTFNDANANDTLQYGLSINGTAIPIPVSGGGAGVATPNFTEGETAPSLTELRDGINAVVGTTGVRAYVDAGVLYLANTTAGAGAISVSETLSGSTDATDAVTGFFGSALTGSNPTRTTSINSGGDSYVMVDGANAVQTSGTYADGGAISFSGLQTDIKGDPANGDSFTIAPSTNQSIFQAVQNIVATLTNSDPSAAGTARVQSALGRALSELDLSMDNVSRVRAKVGARLAAMDSQQEANDAFKLTTKTNLSKIQDLDFAEATSDLNLFKLGLDAAQLSFVKLQGLSLFNYL